jgi:cardiolipin synthase
MNNNGFRYKFYSTTTAAWEGMLQALRAAQKSIFWEVYIFYDDEYGKKFIEVLCAQAQVGKEVKMIIDSLGSIYFSRAAQEQLQKAGVQIIWYNRLHPEWNIAKWVQRIWIRNHRKVLLIDEKSVFVGGVNVEAVSAEWDDVQLYLEGDIVKPLLRGFAKTYIRCGGNRQEVQRFLHPEITQGLERIRSRINFILHHPQLSLERSRIRRFYLKSLRRARKSFTLLTPYFVPDKKFLHLIRRAKKRGVKVSILLPLQSDHKVIEYMSREFYDLTEEAGALVYLLPRMNHGKALSVDSNLGLVGSANFTRRSFISNEETSVYFTDKTMVKELDTIFSKWKEGATLLPQLHKQPRVWYKKVLSWLSGWLKDYV